jgi:serine beta-lactamase-like protein LACTB
MYRALRCQWKIIAIVAAVAAATSGCGGGSQAARAKPPCRQSVAAPAYRQAISADRPLLWRLKEGLRAPGLSLAVAAHGKIVWSVSCGYADLKSRRPVTAHTRFRIGSVSKTLTATALARLAESGRVDLDAPVDRYVDFPSHGGAITLRRLSGHLAGIRHYESRAEAVNRRHFASVADTLTLFRDDPLVAEPETRFTYSSYGYDVIGAALERVSGRDFASLMRESVLVPAHMRETTLATAPRAERTTFYELKDSGGVRVAPPIDLSDRLPAGGFLSTADDLARFGVALTDGTPSPSRTPPRPPLAQCNKGSRTAPLLARVRVSLAGLLNLDVASLHYPAVEVLAHRNEPRADEIDADGVTVDRRRLAAIEDGNSELSLQTRDDVRLRPIRACEAAQIDQRRLFGNLAAGLPRHGAESVRLDIAVNAHQRAEGMVVELELPLVQSRDGNAVHRRVLAFRAEAERGLLARNERRDPSAARQLRTPREHDRDADANGNESGHAKSSKPPCESQRPHHSAPNLSRPGISVQSNRSWVRSLQGASPEIEILAPVEALLPGRSPEQTTSAASTTVGRRKDRHGRA